MLDYLQYKRSTLASTSIKHYERWVIKFHTFLQRDTCDFTLNDVTGFKMYLQECEYAPRNIQYGLSIIRDYIHYQISMHGLQFPLMLFKIKQERSQSHYPINQIQFERMVAVLKENEPQDLQRKLMISMLWDTGMRGGELLRLRMRDITDRGAIIMNEKNHRSRMIVWSLETNRLLKRYLPLRNHLKGEDYIFVSFKYRPVMKLTTRQLERIVIEVRKKAGIRKPIRPHSFRHGFVHRQLDEGKPITTVAQMLGHSSTMNVMNYAQLTSPEIKKAWGLI